MSKSKFGDMLFMSLIKLILAMIFVVFTASLFVITSNHLYFSTFDFQLSNFCIILGGIICGGPSGFLIGAVSPIIIYFSLNGSFEFSQMIIMCIELSIVGCSAGYMYKIFKKSYIFTFLNVLFSIIIGIITNFSVHYITIMISHSTFDFSEFIKDNIYVSIFGYCIELLLIPYIMFFLQKTNLKIIK